ncbi:hypothetical protein VTI74DRAFT_4657 [Chaetomium olivicolor]
MADKFEIPTLKLLARDRFYRTAEVAWDDAERIPAVAASPAFALPAFVARNGY